LLRDAIADADATLILPIFTLMRTAPLMPLRRYCRCRHSSCRRHFRHALRLAAAGFHYFALIFAAPLQLMQFFDAVTPLLMPLRCAVTLMPLLFFATLPPLTPAIIATPLPLPLTP
jgi:hypothetical protein